MPVEHRVHVLSVAASKPALQVQAVLDCAEYESSGHEVQELARSVLPYIPEVQFVQAVPASAFWNFPAAHTMQALPPTAVEKVPTPQDAHTADPVTFLYVPDAHCVHVSGFVY